MRGLRYHLGPVSHILAGLLPLIWHVALTYSHTHTLPHPALPILCAVFALLPDLDSAASHVGRLFPWLSRPLERRFGHRTVTHSLLATGSVALVTFLLFRDGWVWLTAAYFSHLALDMLVGEQGVPLLWPGPWRFYLASVRPAATGEIVVTLLLLTACVLPLVWPTAAASAAGIVPRPPQPTSTPTQTPTPTPTPETIVVRIPHVYDPQREILVQPGDTVAAGMLLADLQTYRAIIATPVPSMKASLASGGVDSLELAQAEADLALAEARYHAAIAAPTPNAVVVATLAPQATAWAQYVTDREETLRREPPDSKRAWIARDELEQNGPQATAVAYRLDAAMHPPGPDPLAVDVARAQLEAARARYQAAIATQTPMPWETATPEAAVVDAADPTRVHALVAGRVVEVRIISVVGNEATVEVVIEAGAE
jgi:membrane-bound metal-dependent hydrolase YbcI (DUF457 family)